MLKHQDVKILILLMCVADYYPPRDLHRHDPRRTLQQTVSNWKYTVTIPGPTTLMFTGGRMGSKGAVKASADNRSSYVIS